MLMPCIAAQMHKVLLGLEVGQVGTGNNHEKRQD